jgi:peptidyl-prolyl cis-trans isomerase D
MIRFLQSDNRITKALFVVVIGAASVAMVVYLIPGLTGAGSAAPDTFAVVYPHWYSKILSSGDTISQTHVQQVAESELRQRGPQYASNPMIVQYFEQQVGQELVQQKVLLQEGRRCAPVPAHRSHGAGYLSRWEIHRRRSLQATGRRSAAHIGRRV